MTTTHTTTSRALDCKRFSSPGIVFDILVSDAESKGSIVIAEFQALPGCEPPRHVHSREDEIFMISEGEITFFIGDDIVQGKGGDTIFLPRNVPHHFVITSSYMKATVMATPSNIEHFFRSISVPYEGDTVPAAQIPTQAEVDHFVHQTMAYGMQFV